MGECFFWYWPTWVVPDKRPLNGCVVGCCSSYLIGSLNTHTHPFNGLFSSTTRVSHYQKGKTNLGFTEARDSEWQRHQLGRMHVCTSLQTDNHTSVPLLSFFTGGMPFLLPNQQCQSTEGSIGSLNNNYNNNNNPRLLVVDTHTNHCQSYN